MTKLPLYLIELSLIEPMELALKSQTDELS